MRATKGGMGLIVGGLFLIGIFAIAMGTTSQGISSSAAKSFPGLSVKDYECKPEAAKAVTELQRTEKRLSESEHLLSKYKQFGKGQHRVPAILFMGAAEDISQAYRAARGNNWIEDFPVEFPSRVTWKILERYVNGFWSTWIDKELAERFVLERSLVPARSNFDAWFVTNVWKPAQQRTQELFSLYEQQTVNPLKHRWAFLMSELTESGLCEKKTVLASKVDCSKMLALVKETMQRDLSDASQLYAGLGGADKAHAKVVPGKLLGKMKDWRAKADEARFTCPIVADYIDNALNMWLCGVGPSGAEDLRMRCGMGPPGM